MDIKKIHKEYQILRKSYFHLSTSKCPIDIFMAYSLLDHPNAMHVFNVNAMIVRMDGQTVRQTVSVILLCRTTRTY